MNDKNISKVHLLGVPLENDYKHTLYFGSASAQQSYFSSKTKYTFSDFSYQRKDNTIRVPKHIDSLWSCNYVMYQNTYYNNKWFYAFIKDMKYISEGMTEISIETDVIQTWMFDYTIKESFVEREHVDDDTIGKHTIPEGLETGEYTCTRYDKLTKMQDCVLVMASTIDPVITTDGDGDGELNIGGSVSGGIYNGIRTGYKYYTFLNNASSQLPKVLDLFDKEGKSDAIAMMFLAPKVFIETAEGEYADSDWDNEMIKDSYIARSFKWSDYDATIVKPTSLDSYTPTNNKLLTFPYCYLMMDNNNGGNAIYHFEKFKNPSLEKACEFKIFGSISPSMDIFLTPTYYNGSVIGDGENFSESLSAGKFPICGWSSDVYTNWLTQNAVNIATNWVSATMQVASGVGLMASGGGALAGASMVASGGLSIATTLGEIYKHSLVPNQASGNMNTGNAKFSQRINTFSAYTMTIKSEYAKIIDKFMNVYGYKVNAFKVPNKNHRNKWWYTKTIDVNIDGNIPQTDLQRIKDCYNNGITFWKNASEIQNYSLANDIV